METDERGTAYTIGLRALRVGGALLERDPVVQAVGPLLARAGKQLDETIHLGRLESADFVYLASRESEHHLRVSSRIGRRPAYATALGKSLLAARPWEEVDALLPAELTAVTPKTVTDRAALQAELDDTRVRGWAVEREQTTLGLTCFAVAVPTHHPHQLSQLPNSFEPVDRRASMRGRPHAQCVRHRTRSARAPLALSPLP